MSISLDLRNFKNPVDRARKIADYREFLKLQQKLNANADRANKEYAKNQTLGITPHRPNPAYASAEEALQDSVEQKIIAMGHIRTIFPYGVDASSALNMLDPSVPIGASHSEVAMFNQNWEGFFSEIKSKANITPEFFGNLWERYKLRLARTDFTGISLPLDDTKLNARLKAQSRLIIESMRQNKENFNLSGKQIQEAQEAIEQAIANRDQSLLLELSTALKDGNTELMDKIIQEARMTRVEAERISTDTSKLLEELKKEISNKVFLSNLSIEVLQSKLKRTLAAYGHWSEGDEVTWMDDEGDEHTKKFTRETGTYFNAAQGGMNKRDLVEALLFFDGQLITRLSSRSRRAPSSRSSSSVPATQQANALSLEREIHSLELKIQQRTESLQERQRREVETGRRLAQARTPAQQRSAEEAHERARSKVQETRQKIEQDREQLAQARQERDRLHALYGVGVKKHRKIYGRGISASNQERYAEFGKYIIHLPSLRKSILNLKFPSAGAIPHIPSQHISEELKDFISNLVANGRIDQRFYNKLTKEDKSIFETVAEKADISDVLGIKIENTEKKEAIKRFELLRGEMIAGNDAPEVRTELKQHLIRFMADGTIPKIQGNQILLELSVM
jgi:hypothetical protein